MTIIEIRKCREAAGLDMTELAKKMGVSTPTICRWEKGVDFPSAARLPMLAAVLGCTIDELFGRASPGQNSA